MKYRVALFDLDGTVLNTLDDLADATNAVLAANKMPLHTKDEIRMFVGNGIRRLIERAVPVGTSEETVVDDDIQKGEAQNDQIQNNDSQNGETESWLEPSGDSEESKDNHSNNDVTSNPLVNLTLATFLNAELGFFGVVV